MDRNLIAEWVYRHTQGSVTRVVRSGPIAGGVSFTGSKSGNRSRGLLSANGYASASSSVYFLPHPSSPALPV